MKFCRARKWSQPDCVQLREEGEPHNKLFFVQYQPSYQIFTPSGHKSATAGTDPTLLQVIDFQ